MIQEYKYDTHEEWLAIRNKYIGGSDAGAIVGLNPYQSAYTLWAEKTGKIPAFAGSLTTEVGAYLEEFVAKMFEDHTNKKVRRKNRTLVNDLYPFACANVDRLVVGEKALLEIKTTNSFPIMKQCRGSEFPEQYYTQVVHYLAVTGLERAYLAVLINCREFKIFTMERDQAEIDALMKAEKDFWRLVGTKTPPAVDGTDSTSDTLKTLYPNSDGSKCDLSMFDGKLTMLQTLKGQIKNLQTEQKKIEQEVQEFMGNSEIGESNLFKISYKNQSRSSFDDKKYISDHPGVDVSMYYKQTTFRKFGVTEKKEGKKSGR